METPREADATSAPDVTTRGADDDVERNEANAIITRLGMRQHAEGGYYAVRVGLIPAPCTKGRQVSAVVVVIGVLSFFSARFPFRLYLSDPKKTDGK